MDAKYKGFTLLCNHSHNIPVEFASIVKGYLKASHSAEPSIQN